MALLESVMSVRKEQKWLLKCNQRTTSDGTSGLGFLRDLPIRLLNSSNVMMSQTSLINPDFRKGTAKNSDSRRMGRLILIAWLE